MEKGIACTDSKKVYPGRGKGPGDGPVQKEENRSSNQKREGRLLEKKKRKATEDAERKEKADDPSVYLGGLAGTPAEKRSTRK